MATHKDTVDDLLARLASLDVRARAMFGEYCLYCDDKVVALICDDRVYLKPTAAAAASGHTFEHAPPYDGAKDHLVAGEQLAADGRALAVLVQATADELPRPRAKKKVLKKKAGRAPARTRSKSKKRG